MGRRGQGEGKVKPLRHLGEPRYPACGERSLGSCITMPSSLFFFTKELLVSYSDGSIHLTCKALNQIV